MSHVVSEEVIERAKREREFFDSFTRVASVSDDVLMVPRDFDVPPEIGEISLDAKTVCDFGCGWGLSACQFALRGALTYAFDISPANIAVAKRAAQINKIERKVFLQVMQAECLSYKDNFFDYVFGTGVLHHIDIAAAAYELRRVLKPGGTAVFLEPLGENALLEWARRHPWRSSAHGHSADEVSFRYADIDKLRKEFSDISYRELGLLSVVKSVCRRLEVGMVAVPRWQRALAHLTKVDEFLIDRMRWIRPWAQYIVVSMKK
jgi:ubiquinone/menaquinone biosynthesis C-methylase UbiE